MAEAVTAAPAVNAVAAPTTAQPPADTTVYAGKYQGVEKLEQGLRELHKSQGLAPLPDGSLIGEGRFKDAKEMEAAYKKVESVIGRPKEPAAPKPDTAMFPKEPTPENDAVTPDGDVDIEKVLSKSGFTKAEIFRLEEANALTEGVLNKLRENHPEYSKMSPRAGNKALLNDIRIETGVVKAQRQAAAEVVGGADALAKLGANWTEYVPPERQNAIAGMMNNPQTYVEAALLLKQYHETKYGTGTGPKPISGGVPTPTSPEATAKAKSEALTRISKGIGKPEDFAVFGKKG